MSGFFALKKALLPAIKKYLFMRHCFIFISMKRIAILTTLLCILYLYGSSQTADSSSKYVLVIHGGAGTILKKNMTAEKEQAYRTALEQALKAGYNKLQQGASALDAVQATIVLMEDCPLFNAGK